LVYPFEAERPELAPVLPNLNRHDVGNLSAWPPLKACAAIQEGTVSILWTIIVGFIAGVVAKFLIPGPNEPSGFVLTTILGIVGAFVASYLGQALGWYAPGEGAGIIGAIVGAIIVLTVWAFLSKRGNTA
jgi:uncharacterized membrane protein YeaQ/YmgE (transglycosylase-associated protein family)